MEPLEIHFTEKNRRISVRDFPGGPWLGLSAFTAEGAGSIPRRELRSQKRCGMAKKTVVWTPKNIRQSIFPRQPNTFKMGSVTKRLAGRRRLTIHHGLPFIKVDLEPNEFSPQKQWPEISLNCPEGDSVPCLLEKYLERLSCGLMECVMLWIHTQYLVHLLPYPCFMDLGIKKLRQGSTFHDYPL